MYIYSCDIYKTQLDKLNNDDNYHVDNINLCNMTLNGLRKSFINIWIQRIRCHYIIINMYKKIHKEENFKDNIKSINEEYISLNNLTKLIKSYRNCIDDTITYIAFCKKDLRLTRDKQSELMVKIYHIELQKKLYIGFKTKLKKLFVIIFLIFIASVAYTRLVTLVTYILRKKKTEGHGLRQVN